MFIIPRLPALLVLLAATVLLTPWTRVAAQDLTVNLDNREHGVETRVYQDRTYYSLNDLAEALDLPITELSSNQVRITGPRGELNLSAGRRLVRLSDQYVALSADVLRRGSRDWYVPRGFLEKALPLVLNRKLDFLTDDSIRVESLARNQVQVSVTNYPDHVTIVLQAQRSVTPDVSEFRQYIEVQFDEFLVEPRMASTTPDPKLVGSVDFDSQNAFGAFRIMKGPGYGGYREYFLENPLRLVIDVYGDSLPDVVESGPGMESTSRSYSSDSPGDRPSEIDPFDERDRGVIVLDPGHGGDDPGVRSQELSEKLLVLRLAREVEERLAKKGESVRLTRGRDVSLPAEQRSSIANYFHSRAFLALHFGGAPSSETRGPVVYTYSPISGDKNGSSSSNIGSAFGASGVVADLTTWHDGQESHFSSSQKLASILQSELNQLFGTDNSASQLPLEVLAPIQAPAVVIEAGFLTNPEDSKLLASAEFQERLADAISQALWRFLE